MRSLGDFILLLASFALLGLVAAGGIAAWLLTNYGSDIPDYSQLKNYEPPVVTRVYTGDGRLMAEFAEEKRVFMPIEAIPAQVKEAFLSAEDKNFYQHAGLDFRGIARAMLTNVRNLGTDNRQQGASTITQQVAKNLILTNEVSYQRKFKEAILAIRMERAMSKDRLLELYLNEIYLGRGAYGVAAAAQIYFDKALDELTVEESAFLAALPKAPNNYNPARRMQAALDRRNWVISRMLEDGYITAEQAKSATLMPIQTADLSADADRVSSPYFAEEIRRFLQSKYGNDGLLKDGLLVRSTMDPHLQDIATRAFRGGLAEYDRRHGYRGPAARWGGIADWQAKLAALPRQKGMLEDWQLAVILTTKGEGFEVGLADGSKQKILPADEEWAGDRIGSGDVVMVSPPTDYLDRKTKEPQKLDADGNPVEAAPKKVDPRWRLRQVPAVQGGLVAIDPRTGRVLAMQGGWDYAGSEFNRVTQAMRQLGSSFKPFVYLTALEEGYTPSSLVLDAPISFSMGYGQGTYAPTNYKKNEYGGLSTLRVGVEKSRNLMTVRLAAQLGMDAIGVESEKFGIYDKMGRYIANALGSQETTLLRNTAAYAMLVNGGKKITPTFIDRIQDRRGKTIYSRDTRECADCGPRLVWTPGQPVPEVPDTREQLVDPRIAYQMVSILEGVVQRGTAASMKDLPYPLAGKTGTTNDSRDVWFVGFSPDLAVGAYLGYDQPKSLGAKETGASGALPVFRRFMEEALKDMPVTPFRMPPGVTLVEVNASSGRRTSPDDPNAILEAFVKGEEPTGGDDIAPVVSAPYMNDGSLDSTGQSAVQGEFDPSIADEDAAAAPYTVPAGTPLAPLPASPALQGTGGLY